MARKKKKTQEAEPVEREEPELEEAEPTEPPADELGDESAPTDADLPVIADEGTQRLPVSTERSLVRHDPLTAYVQEIRRYPLLTREDEHDLAVQYYKTGDLAAARRLVEANLRLV